MKAMVLKQYGSPDVLEIGDIDRPAVKKNEVLVRVHAAALHRGDCYVMRGKPFAVRMVVGLTKPRKNFVLGFDAAGRVEEVGGGVTRFRPGDEVFGSCDGACAQYARGAEDKFVMKPADLTFEQAAAVPTSALAALQGLRDAGQLKPGQKVLINGASGGVGTYAVQIAKSMGAEVTGVCGTANVDMVLSIGADSVIDYTREDFTRGGPRYDLILDNVANHPMADCRRALTPRGTYISNGGGSGMSRVFKAFFLSLFVRRQGRPYISTPKREDLMILKELLEGGKITPVLDRTFPLSDVPDALRYLEKGHAKGKIVITMD
jgi:NADPH:quinone reductase-like Zn-dependent oxidoreductase